MANAKTPSTALPWIAGAVAFVTGSVLLWNRYEVKKAEEAAAKPPPPDAPPEKPTCDAGYAYNPTSHQCDPLKATTPSVIPSLLPDASTMKGPFLPPRAKVVVIGGQLAVGLAHALAARLAEDEATLGVPVTPSAISVWDGSPTMHTFETLVAELGVHGVPTTADGCEACPPDVVIVFAGEFNMHYGPVDDGTQAALTHLARTFSSWARDHYPNVLWVSPPSSPDYEPPPFLRELQAMVLTTTAVAAPLRGAYLNPSQKTLPMVDNVYPTAEGYADLARQVSSVLLAWYASHPGATS